MAADRTRLVEICDNAQARAATVIKQQFVADYVVLGLKNGFDLLQGDVVLVHESDVPQAVTLIRERDPVWINSTLAEPGKCLFVDRNAKLSPLYSRLNA